MIFDAGHLPDGRHFIVMEFVEGENASQALAREGRFDHLDAVEIATQICDVLEEAHRLGIIHRDSQTFQYPASVNAGLRDSISASRKFWRLRRSRLRLTRARVRVS
jgi:serine/threonine protein kinase